MFKQIRTFLAFILCLSLIIGTALTIISCNDDDDDKTTTTTTTTTTEKKAEKDDPVGGTTTTTTEKKNDKDDPVTTTTTTTTTKPDPEPEPETCSFYTLARRISGKGTSNGGDVRDLNDDSIAYFDYNDPVGTERTLVSFCYPDYYFIGWYSDDAALVAADGAKLFSSDGYTYALISEEETYTFTLEKDVRICALYAHKTDAIEITTCELGGMSERNGEVVKTLVAKGSDDKPSFTTFFYVGFPDGSETSAYCTVDKGGFDVNTVGTYTITVTATNYPYLSRSFEVEVVENGYNLYVGKGTNSGTRVIYNYVNTKLTEIDTVIPEGRLVTVMAVPEEYYGFIGWYDAAGNLVSDELVYTFVMPDRDVEIYAKVNYSWAGRVWVSTDVKGGRAVDGFGNTPPFSAFGYKEEIWRCVDTEFTLTAVADEGYKFVGWYREIDKGLTTKDTEKVSDDVTVTIKSVEEDHGTKIRYYPVFEKIEDAE